MRFRVARREKQFGEFTLTATGRHNVLNALAALIVAQGRGIPEREIAKALATFRSVKRRMDVRGENWRSFGGRRLRASSHGGEGDDRGGSRPLARSPALGHSRTAVKFHAPQSVSGCVAEGVGPRRPRYSRGRFFALSNWEARIVWIRRLLRKVSAPSARMLACFPVPMPSQSISGPRRSRAISF